MAIDIQDAGSAAVVDEAVESRATIDNCEDEPIRIPGSIQRHGFLLLLDESSEIVIGASENATEFIESPSRLLLGARIETVLEREALAVVRALRGSVEVEGLITYLGSFPLKRELYSVVTHRVGLQRVLEFEKVDRLVSPDVMTAVITNFVSKLSTLRDKLALCSAITEQVKNLTGFNRVLLYCFDEAGHATALTEENDGVLPSYLGLRFPASDLPKQARELYVANTVRIIPNSNYVPSPLRGVAGTEMRTFDLSSSTLRSVSPIHLEYMRNMGTMASMSISILFEGRLWGLISCHHAEPKTVPYIVRSSCDLLTKMVSTQMLAFQSATQLESAVHFHAVQRRLLTQMAAKKDHVSALVGQMADLAEVTNASGAAVVIDGQCFLSGKTPNEVEVFRLVEWLGGQGSAELFQSKHLGAVLDCAWEYPDVASGLLAIKISDVRQSYILWFRPEVVSTVAWAGEPTQVGGPAKGLHPRNSFGVWQELLRGQSEPWTPMEIESAREFRTAVMTISLKRAEEAVGVSEARFEQLTHSLPNLVWTSDDDGRVTYVNQRWRELGLADEGLWFEQGRISMEEREQCRSLWRNAVLTGTRFEMEVRLAETLESVEHWNLARAVPFLGADGSRAGWVGTLTDLTERREREMALKLTEKLALTGRMTSVIAHEINNPLEAIVNIHYLLGQEISGNEPALAYVAMAEYELERISGITKQTLRWSKETSQPSELVAAGVLFDDVLHLLAGKIRNREVDVSVRGSETQVFGVIGQLQQVLANLVSNALDAVPFGGRISLVARSVSSGTALDVRDEGSGMSEEIRRNIFKPFFSTKGDLGNGLGLYITKEIVERHGGSITIESAVERGTTVTVCLPSPS